MNKNYVESSLKRFLKRKVKITLGFVVAFMIMGIGAFGAEYKEPVISVGEGNVVERSEENLNLNITDWNEVNGKTSVNYGIASVTKGQANINSKNIEIYSENTEKLHPDRNRFSYGVIVQDSGLVNLGNKETENIKITTVSDWFGIGLYADKGENTGGTINVNANNLEINVLGKGKDGDAYGIYSITRTTVAPEENLSNVVIKAKDTVINVKSEQGKAIGIASWSQGKVKLNDGNVKITAPQLISTRGNAVTEINKNNNSDYVVDLTGDIIFEYASDSGTSVDADVTINLANAQSKFTGRVYSDKSSGDPKPDDLKYDGMVLGLSNGGTWENTGDSFVNNLTLDGGVINNKFVDSDIKVDTLKGNGGAVNMVADIVDGNATSGKLTVDKVDGDNTKLDVNFTGITADDVTTEKFEELATNSVTGDGLAKLDTTVKVEEGLTNGAITGDLGKDGVTNLVQNSSTSTIDGLQALTTNTYIAWKQEMSSLNKRMGELRNSTGDEGVWYRVYAGESEYNKGYKNEYQTYQVGYDKKYSTPNGTGFVGYLVSYTDGDTKYNHNSYGSGENTSVGGGIYGTWLGNCGSYVDLIFKVSRLENEYDVTSKGGVKSSGDYNTFGMSLSAEYGKRFDLTKGLFLEPSVQMNLGRVGSQDYRTSSGLDIEQDTIYTAEGKVGTTLGYNFDRGNVYLRVAGVKEFEGELDTAIDGKNVSEDLGDSWIEYGVGANYRVLENLNIYADLEKTGSAKVETNWQANLGFRYEF